MKSQASQRWQYRLYKYTLELLAYSVCLSVLPKHPERLVGNTRMYVFCLSGMHYFQNPRGLRAALCIYLHCFHRHMCWLKPVLFQLAAYTFTQVLWLGGSG